MLRRLFLALVGLALLGGCGGGSGGSGSGPGTNYTGVTTQAAVTTSNAKALSADAYQGGQISSGAAALGKESTETVPLTSRLPGLANILEGSIDKVVANQSSVAKTVAATVTNTVNGVSGSFTYNIDLNQATGAFSGSIVFSHYQSTSGSVVISGNIAFSGLFNQSANRFDGLNITMNGMQAVEGSLSFALNGTLSLNGTTSAQTLTMNVVLTDNSTNRTCWVKDFTMTLVGNTLSMSGTYYDPTHGFVVMSTVNLLTVTSIGDTPTSGQLLFTGSNNSKARLTFSTSGYTVEADVDGDGTFELVYSS